MVKGRKSQAAGEEESQKTCVRIVVDVSPTRLGELKIGINSDFFQWLRIRHWYCETILGKKEVMKWSQFWNSIAKCNDIPDKICYQILMYILLEIFLLLLNFDHLNIQWLMYIKTEALLFAIIKLRQGDVVVFIKKISIHWIRQPRFSDSYNRVYNGVRYD